jgi:hypothetical protein
MKKSLAELLTKDELLALQEEETLGINDYLDKLSKYFPYIPTKVIAYILNITWAVIYDYLKMGFPVSFNNDKGEGLFFTCVKEVGYAQLRDTKSPYIEQKYWFKIERGIEKIIIDNGKQRKSSYKQYF